MTQNPLMAIFLKLSIGKIWFWVHISTRLLYYEVQ